MTKQFAELRRIDFDHIITPDSDYAFVYLLQKSLLLALQERGRLNVMQYRHAEEKLDSQRRDRVKKLQQQG